MKHYLSNVVLSCETVEELSAAEKALDERGYEYEIFEDSLEVEVYHGLSPQEWDNLISDIENNK